MATTCSRSPSSYLLRFRLCLYALGLAIVIYAVASRRHYSMSIYSSRTVTAVTFQISVPPTNNRTNVTTTTGTRQVVAQNPVQNVSANTSHEAPSSSIIHQPAALVSTPYQRTWTRLDQSPPPPTSFTKLLPHQLKLPTPIIVMGLQKAGTTSIYSYFACGMEGNLSHYDCQPPPAENSTVDRGERRYGMSCGKKMLINYHDKKPLFTDLGNWHVMAEIDAPHNLVDRGIILPQWQWIPQIHAAYPNATWILNTRDPHDWLASIDKWHDLRKRYINSHFPPYFKRGIGKRDDQMITFYNMQAERVRNFTQAHPDQHHHLVEVQIDSPDAGQVLEHAFGISSHCWGHKNRNKGEGKAVWNPN